MNELPRQHRHMIADEAARLIIDHGFKDYGLAKRKAASNLGFDAHSLPRNLEIEEALKERLRLFESEHQQFVNQKRLAAIEAMRFFVDYDPRLVGPVLTGTATEWSDINIHVFADSVEEVLFLLIEHKMPYRVAEHIFKSGQIVMPSIRFVVDDDEFEIVVFCPDQIRRAPPSPIDGKPMRRANLSDVQDLIVETERCA